MHNIRNGPRARRVVVTIGRRCSSTPTKAKRIFMGKHTHDAGEQRQPQVEGQLRLIAATRTAMQPSFVIFIIGVTIK